MRQPENYSEKIIYKNFKLSYIIVVSKLELKQIQ